MIACLRSSVFSYPDRSATVYLELRRKHDLKGGLDAKSFTVSKRTTFNTKVILNKNFQTLNEARRYWLEESIKLEDQGLIRRDHQIINFHEED